MYLDVTVSIVKVAVHDCLFRLWIHFHNEKVWTEIVDDKVWLGGVAKGIDGISNSRTYNLGPDNVEHTGTIYFLDWLGVVQRRSLVLVDMDFRTTIVLNPYNVLENRQAIILVNVVNSDLCLVHVRLVHIISRKIRQIITLILICNLIYRHWPTCEQVEGHFTKLVCLRNYKAMTLNTAVYKTLCIERMVFFTMMSIEVDILGNFLIFKVDVCLFVANVLQEVIIRLRRNNL